MSSEHDLAEVGQLSPRRPQQLLFSFLGALVLDRDHPPISSRVFLHLLGDLGVAEAAGRAALARLTRQGLLERSVQGRTARFSLSPTGETLLRDAAVRVSSPAPFSHPEDEWTLLSYSIPESRRDLRHQIRARLAWAGFGGLRDGLWVAPGHVDLAAVFGGAQFTELGRLADAFYAVPVARSEIGRMLHRAWNVPRVRAQHEAFLGAWVADRQQRGRQLTRLTLLGADWLQLLRTDPGLPAAHLAPDWPAPASAALYRERFDALEPDATTWLRRLLQGDADRR